MSHPTMHVLLIRMNGRLSREDIRRCVETYERESQESERRYLLPAGDPTWWISREISASQGSVVLIGGVWNYGTHEAWRELGEAISGTLHLDVLCTTWDHECGSNLNMIAATSAFCGDELDGPKEWHSVDALGPIKAKCSCGSDLVRSENGGFYPCEACIKSHREAARKAGAAEMQEYLTRLL